MIPVKQQNNACIAGIINFMQDCGYIQSALSSTTNFVSKMAG
jgi:hypothetical protein